MPRTEREDQQHISQCVYRYNIPRTFVDEVGHPEGHAIPSKSHQTTSGQQLCSLCYVRCDNLVTELDNEFGLLGLGFRD